MPNNSESQSIPNKPTILFLGQTGVGKSWLGNVYTTLKLNQKNFQIGDNINKRVTTQPKKVVGELCDVIDTPGFPDTDKKYSLCYLEMALRAIQKYKPNLIYWVWNTERSGKFNVEDMSMSLKELLGPETNLQLFINQKTGGKGIADDKQFQRKLREYNELKEDGDDSEANDIWENELLKCKKYDKFVIKRDEMATKWIENQIEQKGTNESAVSKMIRTYSRDHKVSYCLNNGHVVKRAAQDI